MITPMKLIRLRVFLVSSSALTTPINDSGSDNITGSGAVKLLNWITRIKYISPMPAASAMAMRLNTSCWSREPPASSRA